MWSNMGISRINNQRYTVRRISSIGFSITTQIDKSSENLSEKINWKGDVDLNVSLVFGGGSGAKY